MIYHHKTEGEAMRGAIGAGFDEIVSGAKSAVRGGVIHPISQKTKESS